MAKFTVTRKVVVTVPDDIRDSLDAITEAGRIASLVFKGDEESRAELLRLRHFDRGDMLMDSMTVERLD